MVKEKGISDSFFHISKGKLEVKVKKKVVEE
jgi:hypothetical protein